MLFQISAGVACVAAALMQLVVHLSPDINEPPMKDVARKLTVVGLLVAGLYTFYSISECGEASAPYCLATGLFALGQMLFSGQHLGRHYGRHYADHP
jgi:hypothetical protein